MQAWMARLALLLDGRWELLTARIGRVEWLLPSWAPPVLALGVVAAAVLGTLCYARTTEGLTVRNRVVLALLRTLLLVILLLMVSGVALRLQTAVAVPPRLLVVLDDSGSMDLGHGRSRLAEAEDALDAGGLLTFLRRHYQVDLARTSGPPGAAPAAAGRPQDLARSLIRAAAAAADRPPDRILLVSDGVQLSAEALATAAAELPAPVDTLVAGDAPDVRDTLVESVIVPPFTYRNDRVVAAARVRAVGPEGEALARLYHLRAGNEHEVATAPAVFKAADSATLVRLEFIAETAGLQSYVLRLEPQAGELTERNNAIRFHLDVREERIRVLFVEGEPSWEYRYVRRALEPDPAVQFSGLVRLPNSEWFYQGPLERSDKQMVVSRPKDGFPLPADELNYFDVLILGDLERKAYERGDGFATIEAFVQARGGGLMTIGGLQVYGAGDFEGTALARLLPFEIKREKKGQLINRFQVACAPEGMMHPVMQLEFDPVRNQQVWAGLPWVEGGNAIRAVKPGATRLLVHPELGTSAGPRPLLAAWQSGRGRALASALDGTWHWRLAAETETDYHRRFWGLAVRWLAGDIRERQPLGTLSAEEPVLEVGRQAHFGLVLRTPEGDPMLDAGVTFTLQDASGAALATVAAGDPAVPGRYAVAFTPAQEGELAVTAEIAAADGQTRTQTQTFYVGPSRAEVLRVRAEPDALAALAAATGGHAARLGEWRTLPVAPPAGGLQVQSTTVDLWQCPGLAGLLALCATTEWFMRKRRGLA